MVILLLLLWPLIEIAVFLQVVQWIGVLDTLRRDEVAAPSPTGEPSLGVLPLALEG